MSSTDKVVAMLQRMQRDIRDLQTKPQLGNSSLDGGINFYDPDGSLKGRIGDLPDGSHGVGYFNGKKPPTPTKPILTPCPGGLTIKWDGGFTADPETGEARFAPMDFARVQVFLGDEAGFYDSTEPILRPTKLRGSIESPAGGEIVVVPLAIEVKYVVLVCVNTSGTPSDPSEEASGTPGSWVTDEEIAQIKADLEANDAALVQANSDIDQANIDIAAAFGSAADAATIANRAEGKADAAGSSASAALTTANGKGKSWFQPNAPTASSSFDVWFDTDDGNKPYKWDGAQWVAQPFGDAAIGNLDAGKISTGFLAAARIVAGSLSGDKITANTMNGDRIIANTLNADKIVANSITGDKIGFNTIFGSQIRARDIGADRIAVGAITADEIAANAITASELDAFAVTGKVITGGTFRTGVSGQDRIEMIDQTAYDPYLGYYRSIQDTIRWVRGSDGGLAGEIRGYMGDVGGYGLHLNSSINLGNKQSITHVIGRIAAESQAVASDRIRAGRVIVYATAPNGNGHNVTYNYPVGMDTPPIMWIATVNSGGGGGTNQPQGNFWSALYTITNFQANQNGWSGTVFQADGQVPGAGAQVQISYFCANWA